MQRQWYYAVRGEQRGPVSEENLIELIRLKSLSASDLVWTEGMSDWAEAGSRPELASAFQGLLANAAVGQSVPPGTGNTAAVPQFGFWLSFIGIVNILSGALLTVTCVGIPVAILQIIAGISLLSAKPLLASARSAPPEIAAALAKFRTFFAMSGVILLVQIATIVAALIFMLVSTSNLSHLLSE